MLTHTIPTNVHIYDIQTTLACSGRVNNWLEHRAVMKHILLGIYLKVSDQQEAIWMLICPVREGMDSGCIFFSVNVFIVVEVADPFSWQLFLHAIELRIDSMHITSSKDGAQDVSDLIYTFSPAQSSLFSIELELRVASSIYTHAFICVTAANCNMWLNFMRSGLAVTGKHSCEH